MNPAWLPAIISGLVAALLTSILAPAVQHGFWRRQKCREQKLALAERMSAFLPKLVHIFHAESTTEQTNQLLAEIDALLFSCQILFDKPARQACYNLHILIKQWSSTGDRSPLFVVAHFNKVYQAAADAMAFVYGEIFSKKIDLQWWIPYSSDELTEIAKNLELP